MQRYIARRLLLFIPTALGATIVIFAVMRVMPGDVALMIAGAGQEGAVISVAEVERIRQALSLNDPLPVQYGRWLAGVVTLDPGESLTIRRGTQVMALVGERIPRTLLLAAYTVTLTVIVSVPLGVLAALKQDQWPDHVLRSASIMGVALPGFWVASLFILVAAIFLGWSPPLFYAHPWESPGAHLQKMLPPAIILSWHASGILVRMTRSTMLEVLRQDYIRTANSKGLPARLVLWRHALRNALLPVVTLVGLLVEGTLAGSIVMETIFAIPGIGSLVIQSVQTYDYSVAQFLIVMLALMMMSINLLVDLIYGWADPRVRFG